MPPLRPVRPFTRASGVPGTIPDCTGHLLATLSRVFLLMLLCAGVLPSTAATIRYPRPLTATDVRDDYPLQLLRLALSKANARHELAPSTVAMDQGRALAELARPGGGVDIVWSMTSVEREAALLPVRIPIYKGLISWRIPLVTQASADPFKNVKTLDQLKTLTAGQGHDWPDTDILRSNGLNVVGVSSYGALFRMLSTSRFDYFPRSIVEIWAEADAHRADDIVVDPHIIIRYPSAFYYFVSPKNQQLADTVRRGLEAAIADGSFDRLFYQRHAALIAKANLAQRTVIDLKNPLLPPQTPLNRPELWFHIEDLGRLTK